MLKPFIRCPVRTVNPVPLHCSQFTHCIKVQPRWYAAETGHASTSSADSKPPSDKGSPAFDVQESRSTYLSIDQSNGVCCMFGVYRVGRSLIPYVGDFRVATAEKASTTQPLPVRRSRMRCAPAILQARLPVKSWSVCMQGSENLQRTSAILLPQRDL